MATGKAKRPAISVVLGDFLEGKFTINREPEHEAADMRRVWRDRGADMGELMILYGRPRAVVEAALGPEVVAALAAGRPVYRVVEPSPAPPPMPPPEVKKNVFKWLEERGDQASYADFIAWGRHSPPETADWVLRVLRWKSSRSAKAPRPEDVDAVLRWLASLAA